MGILSKDRQFLRGIPTRPPFSSRERRFSAKRAKKLPKGRLNRPRELPFFEGIVGYALVGPLPSAQQQTEEDDARDGADRSGDDVGHRVRQAAKLAVQPE